jgi:hypothetical protein
VLLEALGEGFNLELHRGSLKLFVSRGSRGTRQKKLQNLDSMRLKPGLDGIKSPYLIGLESLEV